MDDNSPGSTASYYCNEDHKLVGNKNRKCLKNGKWSGQEPVCKRKHYIIVRIYIKIQDLKVIINLYFSY